MTKVTLLDSENKIFLYESTMQEEMAMVLPEHRDVAFARLVTLAGCYSIKIDAEQLEAAKAVVNGPMPAIEPGHYVVMLDEFTRVLTEEQRAAVLEHELAHIREGHLNREPVDGVILELELEMAADRAAVAAVNSQAMAGAIVALLNRSHDYQRELAVAAAQPELFEIIEASRAECLSHPIITARLAALQ